MCIRIPVMPDGSIWILNRILTDFQGLLLYNNKLNLRVY